MDPTYLHAPRDPAEERRLAALHLLELSKAPLEKAYQEVVDTAAALCGATSGLMTLIDQEDQWIPVRCGWQGDHTSRDVAFCDRTIREERLMEVQDARENPHFQDNPLVTGPPGIIFYAGVPIHAPGGERIGSLCVIDTTQPHRLDEDQKAALWRLGRHMDHLLALRSSLLSLQRRPPRPLPQNGAGQRPGALSRRLVQKLADSSRSPVTPAVLQMVVLQAERRRLSPRGAKALDILERQLGLLREDVEEAVGPSKPS